MTEVLSWLITCCSHSTAIVGGDGGRMHGAHAPYVRVCKLPNRIMMPRQRRKLWPVVSLAFCAVVTRSSPRQLFLAGGEDPPGCLFALPKVLCGCMTADHRLNPGSRSPCHLVTIEAIGEGVTVMQMSDHVLCKARSRCLLCEALS